eukprot:scaffold571800_cov22-Prasinocladus_malaysianus.AAC.1
MKLNAVERFPYVAGVVMRVLEDVGHHIAICKGGPLKLGFKKILVSPTFGAFCGWSSLWR